MSPGPARLGDWRNAAAYASLLDCDRSAFAWEWLRRDPAYRRAAAENKEGVEAPVGRAQPQAAPFGLHAFEDPDLPAWTAQPVWRAEAQADILSAEAEAGEEGDDLFDLEQVHVPWRLVRGELGQEHLLLTDGCQRVRLDIVRGTIVGGPVLLRHRLAGIASLERPLLLLRGLSMVWRTGGFPQSLFPRERRARRWIALLRTADALAGDASQREIAAALLGAAADNARWRVNAPSLRSAAQRLVRASGAMRAGGWRRLLA